MFFGKYNRSCQTTIPCRSCQTPISAERSCREVTLRCTGCGARFQLKDYIQQMDEALETFLSQAFCDRI